MRDLRGGLGERCSTSPAKYRRDSTASFAFKPIPFRSQGPPLPMRIFDGRIPRTLRASRTSFRRVWPIALAVVVQRRCRAGQCSVVRREFDLGALGTPEPATASAFAAAFVLAGSRRLTVQYSSSSGGVSQAQPPPEVIPHAAVATGTAQR